MNEIVKIDDSAKANNMHGRLLEAVHNSGYSFERACTELEWLLDEDRWKSVGTGYEDINKFLATINFSEFKIAIDQRKKIAKKLKELEATQRAAAKMLGVDASTINRDINVVANATKQETKVLETQEKDNQDVANATKSPLDQSPTDVWNLPKKKAENEIKKQEKVAILNNPPTQHIKTTPTIHKKSFQDFNIECDLLITDPPYMTDVENINEFVKWLPEKLSCVKSTGAAFICVGAYPEELTAYMNMAMPTQVLVWTYKNTLGQTPKRKYKLNWQAILYYRMPDAPELNYTITNEMWAVQEFNAPDGRLGDRYHTWQKPIELAKRLIRHNTKEGDIIFDCFSGTGTFLIAAAELGRRAVGCEIDNNMIEIAIKRGCSYER